MIPYRLLFLLQSPAVTIFEIERLDLPTTAPKSERYCWLHYETATAALTPLDFVHMRSAPPLEERQFRQGKLHFSAAAGTFWPAITPGAPHSLASAATLELPAPVAAQVTVFLAGR